MQLGKTAVATLAAATIIMGGCETSREEQGNVIGAIAGGVLGSQVGSGSGKTAATIAGILLGGYLGGRVGRQMDENDRYEAGQALETTPTDEHSTWQNPDSGTAYTLTPTRTYYDSSQPCREYTTEAWIDGRRETLYGTACRQSDGTWLAGN